MRIEKQSFPIIIKNHNALSNNFRKHGKLFEGNNKRVLILGPVGCGKTSVVISLSENPNGLWFDNLYMYSKSLYQPKYEHLKTLFKSLKEIVNY